MDLISDIFLAAAALGAMVYCLILSRRLSQLNDLDKGMGGAIAVLSVQVDDMTKALGKAQNSAALSRSDLVVLTERSEAAAHRLELILASMHDIPEFTQQPAASVPETRRETPVPREAKVEAPTWRTRRAVKEAV